MQCYRPSIYTPECFVAKWQTFLWWYYLKYFILHISTFFIRQCIMIKHITRTALWLSFLSLVHNMTQSRASRRVAWRCGALQRVGWFTIFAHTHVCDVQPPHPSHVYSVQSTKFTIDHERELEIVLVLALYLRQRRRRKCGRSMWIRGIFTRRQ